MEVVVQLKENRRLSLYGASLTDDRLANLQNLKWVESLGLGGTSINDKSLDHLEKLAWLPWLWLSANGQVSEERVERLQKALPNLTVFWQ